MYLKNNKRISVGDFFTYRTVGNSNHQRNGNRALIVIFFKYITGIFSFSSSSSSSENNLFRFGTNFEGVSNWSNLLLISRRLRFKFCSSKNLNFLISFASSCSRAKPSFKFSNIKSLAIVNISHVCGLESCKKSCFSFLTRINKWGRNFFTLS